MDSKQQQRTSGSTIKKIPSISSSSSSFSTGTATGVTSAFSSASTSYTMLSRCNSNLTNIQRQIKMKEEELIEKEKANRQIKAQTKDLKNQIEKLTFDRRKINDDILQVQMQVNEKSNEMNRIRSHVIFMTKKEHEHEIMQLEYEMQSQRSFNQRNETRILQDIRTYKNSMTALDSYESAKQGYEDLNRILTAKKDQLKENLKSFNNCRNKFTNAKTESKTIADQIAKIKEELVELEQRRVRLKKQREDLNREHLLRQLQLKRENANNKLKEDEILQTMEKTLIDYNKLITYFQKICTSNSLEQHQSSSTGSTQTIDETADHHDTTNNNTSELSSNTNNKFINSKKALRLSLSFGPTTASNFNTSLRSSFPISPATLVNTSSDQNVSSLTPSSFPTVSTPDDSSASNGLFLVKKKTTDENEDGCVRRKNFRKHKQKNMKFSHNLEVINLLIKMNVPVKLSSTPNECLTYIMARQAQLAAEIKEYKTKQLALIEAAEDDKSSVSVEGTSASVASNSENCENLESTLPFKETTNNRSLNNCDNNSEICSSLMDSNYDSDHSLASCSNKNSPLIKEKEIKQEASPPKEPVVIEQKTITTIITTHNSDDSDATINDSSAHDRKICSRNQSSSSSSSVKERDNNLEIKMNELLINKQEKFGNISANDKEHGTKSQNTTSISETQSAQILRQISASDGYSSCTPLSASSLNNENLTVNPFFASSSSTKEINEIHSSLRNNE